MENWIVCVWDKQCLSTSSIFSFWTNSKRSVNDQTAVRKVQNWKEKMVGISI